MPLSSDPAEGRRIGIALGGGSARGWAHIGVLRELEAHGIVPDVVAGTSIGAVVGGCHAAGRLDALEAFARGLNRRRMLRLLDLSFSGTGLIAGMRLKQRLDAALQGRRIETLQPTFAALATELGSGQEVCLRKGDLVQAIRASYALPGIFPPIWLEGRWLFDGAMANPVPVSVARRLGADYVIAVSLTSGAPEPLESAQIHDPSILELDALAETIAAAGTGAEVETGPPRRRRLLGLRRRLFRRRHRGTPGMASVTMGAFSVAQERISRSRLAIDPPDALIYARLEGVGLFDFHRAAELIDHGRAATRQALPAILAQLKLRDGV